MKKILFFVTAVFLILATDCKKASDPEPTLADFIVGDWFCSRQMVQTEQADLTIKFTETNYILTVDFSGSFPDFTTASKGYQIFEESDRIKLDYPYSSESFEMAYTVSWEAGKDNMTWTPRPDNEKNITSNPIALYWTKIP
ncbi:MAG: hypothetical protein R6W81_08830 [Bacteroidales bacterium]